MLSRHAKAAFYTVCGPAMKLNGWMYRQFRAPRNGSDTIRVQLGPGQEHYLEGWLNVDANAFTARCDVWADLRNPLPLRDGTVDALYSHHVIEHLPDAMLEAHLRDVYRCLKPGGAFRIAGPNGDMAMRKYVEGDSRWFSNFPDRRESLGGRLTNFIFCRGEHLTILTHSYLEEIARRVGFPALRVCRPTVDTNFPELFDAQVLAHEHEDTLEAPHTLVVEGQKPR
ncbi:MAG TPA: methyltransferase domain-containing protein [Pirellulales bacterium]|jgi:predicted SAM-dependent methyltransferase|nr:methyltransferase domain-containing protein [Pirellulales bacterium]